MEAQGDAGTDRVEGGVEPGLSGWPTEETVMQFWAVYEGPPKWTYEGWLIYRSVRRGMMYSEELILGGPMPAWLALKFLIGVKEVLSHGRAGEAVQRQ